MHEKNTNPEIMIKRMPEYDPDAEIISLALTIPSWVESIKKKSERTNFSETTPQARLKLIEALEQIKHEIFCIETIIIETGGKSGGEEG